MCEKLRLDNEVLGKIKKGAVGTCTPDLGFTGCRVPLLHVHVGKTVAILINVHGASGQVESAIPESACKTSTIS